MGPTRRQLRVAQLLKVMQRTALHAKTLGFSHPVTGERLTYTSEVPADMQACLSALRELSF